MRAGYATTVITPPVPVFLAGYGDRTGPAAAVHDDLEVRVLVYETGGGRCCLVTCDLLALSRDFADPVRAAVARAVDADVDHVVTSCTHVHAGPSTLTGTDAIGWPVPEGYRELLVTRISSAARAAMSTLAPVTVSWKRGSLPHDVAVNRRGYDLTPEAQVLVFDPVASVVNFGIHPTVTGPPNVTITTDWVGPFRRAVERATGMPVVFLQGCQGDVNPSVTSWESGDPASWAPVVDAFAERLAADSVALIAGATPIDASPVVARRRELAVPVGPTLLGRLAGGAATRRIELIDWRLGDVPLVAIPGEGFHGLQQQIAAARAGPLLLAGLAPDWHGYFPVPYADGYEEGLSLGAESVRLIANELVDTRG
jgi:hypothetical protein